MIKPISHCRHAHKSREKGRAQTHQSLVPNGPGCGSESKPHPPSPPRTQTRAATGAEQGWRGPRRLLPVPPGCSLFPRNLPAPPPAGRATAARPPAAAPTLFSSVFPPPGVPFAVRFPGLRPVSPSAFAPGTPCSREPPPTPQAGRGAPLPAPKLVSLPWTLGCVARGRSQTPNERCPRPACLDHRALHPLGLLGCKQRKPALANPRGSEGRVGRGCGVIVSKAEMHVENKEVSSRCSVLLRQEPPSQSLLSLFCLTSHRSDQAAC